ARPVTVKLLDRYDTEVARYDLTLAVINPYGILALPEGLKTIEAGSFEGTSFETLVIPSGVTQIGAQAFGNMEPSVVFCAQPALVSGMFGWDTVIVDDPAAYYRWAND
ncbi:MAG: hypothetical protein IKV51_02195, partial [Clostridia bacterium]|nr:hypothetical protein [Clostridia bacterium]